MLDLRSRTDGRAVRPSLLAILLAACSGRRLSSIGTSHGATHRVGVLVAVDEDDGMTFGVPLSLEQVKELAGSLSSAATVTYWGLGIIGLALAIWLGAFIYVNVPRVVARGMIQPGVAFSVEASARRKRTSVWLKDRLALSSGERFNPRFWPEGLGVVLDVRVTIDDREVFSGPVEIRGSGPRHINVNTSNSGTDYQATKLLLRYDTRPGQRIRVTGRAALMPNTDARSLELLVG